jgi:translin
MDDIYSALVTVDFPDAITGGLRRTTDALRAVLERTRGDVTMAATQGRVERALRQSLGAEFTALGTPLAGAQEVDPLHVE